MLARDGEGDRVRRNGPGDQGLPPGHAAEGAHGDGQQRAGRAGALASPPAVMEQACDAQEHATAEEELPEQAIAAQEHARAEEEREA